MSDINPRTNGEPSDKPSDDLAEFVTSRPDGLDPTDVGDEEIDVDEELRKRARYEAIHQARANAAEALEEASTRVFDLRDRGAGQDEAEGVVANAVRDKIRRYVLELEPYLTTLKVGKYYWDEIPLGVVEFDTLEASAGGAGLGRNNASVERRDPDPVPILGLVDFVEAPDLFKRSIEAEVAIPDPGYGRTTETDRTVEPMPREVSRRAFRAANQFARDAGLDIDPDDGRPTFGTADDEWRE